MYDILQLSEMLLPDLKNLAEKLGLKSYKSLAKQDLIYKILDEQAIKSKNEPLAPKKEVVKPAPKKPAPKPRAQAKKEQPQKTPIAKNRCNHFSSPPTFWFLLNFW